jgi:hypothetical protein
METTVETTGETAPVPTLEETLKYNKAKAILRAPCVLVLEIEPCSQTIKEYEEKFNIPEEERFKSYHISKTIRLNSLCDEDSRAILVEPMCTIEPKPTPMIAEVVSKPKIKEQVDFIKDNEFVPDPRNTKCYGVVPFFKLQDKVWKYLKVIDSGYTAEYINDNYIVESFDFMNEQFRNSVVPVIPSQWLEIDGYKL